MNGGITISKPKHLLVLTNEFEPHIIGGLGIAVTNLANTYARGGINTTVLSRNTSTQISTTKKKSLKIVRFPLRGNYYSSKSFQFQPSVIESWLNHRGYHKPDGVHVHSLQFFKLAKHYKAKYRIPIIYTCHSLIANEAGPKNRKRKIMLAYQVKMLKLANRIVVPSRSELIKLKKRYPFCSNKTVVIRHGIVLRKSRARGPRHHLLFVGRIVPLKGIEKLLRAIAILKRKRKNVRLYVVGPVQQDISDILKHYVESLAYRKTFIGMGIVIKRK